MPWVRPPLVGDAAGDAEVGDHDATAGLDQDVGGLEVAVDHASGVRGDQTVTHRERDADRVRRGERVGLAGPVGVARAQQVLEGRALDELHRDEVGARVLADVVGARDVRVADAPREPDLAAKILQVLRHAGDVAVEDLERDDIADGDVDGAIHRAHAAASDHTLDAVAPGVQAIALRESEVHRQVGVVGRLPHAARVTEAAGVASPGMTLWAVKRRPRGLPRAGYGGSAPQRALDGADERGDPP